MTQEEFHKRYQYSPTNDCLGEGGFGKVFKAYDTHLDKWVAIKMAEVKTGLEQVRLKHEVEIVNKLPTHPNITRYEECYTFSSFTGEYDFAVLQYYESGNLQQLLETKQLTEQQKDSILRQILAGIEFLHNQGIIHRDLKPQNILIVNRNGEYIPKITDFGISKKLDTNKSSVFTNSLAGIGTLAYASPEQLLGQTIKKNTDLWSFGVIVCWIFTGKLPFTAGNQAVTSEAGRIELFRQITAGDVSALIQQLPSVWIELVKQCIVVDVDNRIYSAIKCIELVEIISSLNFSNDCDNSLQIVFNRCRGTYGFRNSKWEKTTEYEYDEYEDYEIYSEGLAKVRKNRKYGYIDEVGNEIIPLKFDFVYKFKEGMSAVKLNGKWGFIDKTGKIIISLIYDGCWFFSEGLAKVSFNGKYGFVDKIGNKIIPIQYDFVGHFSEGLAIVRQNNKYGYIDKLGEKVIPFIYEDFNHLIEYDNIGSFHDGLALVCLNRKWGFIDKTAKEIIPIEFDFADSFKEGLAAVKLNTKWGFINKSGIIVIPFKYDMVGAFSEGLRWVVLNEKYCFIDKFGKEITPLKYDSVHSFVNSMTWVCINDKYGFIDITGKEITPIQYEDFSSNTENDWGSHEEIIFDEGLIWVKYNDKYGYIDKTGKEIVHPKFDSIMPFSEGLARVKYGNQYGFINSIGVEVTLLKYDSAGYILNGLTWVSIDKKYGFLNSKGKEITPIQFDDFEYGFDSSFHTRVILFDKNMVDLISVSLNGIWGYIDHRGNWINDVSSSG